MSLSEKEKSHDFKVADTTEKANTSSNKAVAESEHNDRGGDGEDGKDGEHDVYNRGVKKTISSDLWRT